MSDNMKYLQYVNFPPDAPAAVMEELKRTMNNSDVIKTWLAMKNDGIMKKMMDEHRLPSGMSIDDQQQRSEARIRITSDLMKNEMASFSSTSESTSESVTRDPVRFIEQTCDAHNVSKGVARAVEETIKQAGARGSFRNFYMCDVLTYLGGTDIQYVLIAISFRFEIQGPGQSEIAMSINVSKCTVGLRAFRETAEQRLRQEIADSASRAILDNTPIDVPV